jgi:hypothetical protein
MVAARRTLDEVCVHEDDIRAEEFAGFAIENQKSAGGAK